MEDDEAKPLTESEMKQKLITMRYTSNIDQVFKLSRHEAASDLDRLEKQMRQNPKKFENEYRNLRSYIDDLQK